MPYFQDDFTWCLQKAPKMLWLLSIMTALSPTVWVLVIFGYGYVSGFLLYLLIQFDEKYEQRNNRDWHYTTLLISLPSVIGTSQRFRPHSIKIRFIYAFFLIAMIFCVQYATVNMYKFVQIRFSKHQISTLDEMRSYGMTLIGSEPVRRILQIDPKASNLRFFLF